MIYIGTGLTALKVFWLSQICGSSMSNGSSLNYGSDYGSDTSTLVVGGVNLNRDLSVRKSYWRLWDTGS